MIAKAISDLEPQSEIASNQMNNPATRALAMYHVDLEIDANKPVFASPLHRMQKSAFITGANFKKVLKHTMENLSACDLMFLADLVDDKSKGQQPSKKQIRFDNKNGGSAGFSSSTQKSSSSDESNARKHFIARTSRASSPINKHSVSSARSSLSTVKETAQQK